MGRDLLGLGPGGGRRAATAIHQQGRLCPRRAAPPAVLPPPHPRPARWGRAGPSKTLGGILSVSEADGWIVWTKGGSPAGRGPVPEVPHKTEGATLMESSFQRL